MISKILGGSTVVMSVVIVTLLGTIKFKNK